MGIKNGHLVNLFDEIPDYGSILHDFSLSYKESKYYLHVGEPIREQGWMLHVSVLYNDVLDLLKSVLPELSSWKIPFKIVKNRALHESYNNGEFGQPKIGKIVTIYLENENEIERLTLKLVSLTNQFFGPRVVTDFKVGKVIYARYGAFKPNIKMDGFGNLDRVIMGSQGNWLKDNYFVPSVVPSGVHNPFTGFINSTPSFKTGSQFYAKYKLHRLIQYSVGKVLYEASYENEGVSVIKCFVSRGKRGISTDAFGRDMIDRVQWQMRIINTLSGHVPVPKIIDYVEEQDSAFLVMDWIEGDWLVNILKNLRDGATWHELSHIQKSRVLGYSLKLADILDRIHRLGLLYRNANMKDIYIGVDGKLYLMNLELAYKMNEDDAYPAFKGDNDGFESPNQSLGAVPRYEDDMYGFGAFLINIATELPPSFVIEEASEVRTKLNFLINDSDLVGLILTCISESLLDIPSWKTIKHNILSFIGIERGMSKIEEKVKNDLKGDISSTIERGLYGLGLGTVLSGNLWVSQIDNKYDREIYPLGNKHTFAALYRGVGGVLYLLCKAKALGWNISHLDKPMQASWNFIKEKSWERIDSVVPGLYYGSSGLAVLIGGAFQAEILPITGPYLDLMDIAFQRVNLEHNVIYGIAGNGLAVLQSSEYLESRRLISLLVNISNQLVRQQDNNGGWSSINAKSGRKEVLNGFGYGVAGVVYYLLVYGHRYNDYNAIRAANLGLGYLDGVMIDSGESNAWTNSNVDLSISRWWCNGAPGIALSYLKSYELTGNTSHLLTAERSLRTIPMKIVNRNYGQCHGLSGLGEIYLEFFRVTGSKHWLDRASWIAEFLCTLKFNSGLNAAYWMDENGRYPVTDFMTGGGGILHFLLRYLTPDRVFFPLLPN